MDDLKVNQRFHHLDSLRGLAALGVAATHSIECFKDIKGQEYLNNILGQSAVIFFFLLSGFVLSKSLQKDLSPRGIACYYIKRIFRLYPAAIVSIILAAVAAHFYDSTWNHMGASSFIKEWMIKAESLRSLGDYVNAGLLQSKSQYLNSPLWTIRAEFICSFLLPVVLLLVRIDPRILMPLSIVLMIFLSRGIQYNSRFLFIFFMGFLIQKAVTSMGKFTSESTKWFLMLTTALWLFSMRFGFDLVAETIILGAILLILVPCKINELKGILCSRPLLFLGRISYSFYLVHFPLLFISWMLLAKYQPELLVEQNRVTSILVLFLISIVMTIPVAVLIERFIESPFNKLGHRFSSRLMGNQ